MDRIWWAVFDLCDVFSLPWNTWVRLVLILATYSADWCYQPSFLRLFVPVLQTWTWMMITEKRRLAMKKTFKFWKDLQNSFSERVLDSTFWQNGRILCLKFFKVFKKVDCQGAEGKSFFWIFKWGWALVLINVHIDF